MDVDATRFDHHPLDHQSKELLPLRERECPERLAHAAGKVLEAHAALRLLLDGDLLVTHGVKAALHMPAPLLEQRLATTELIKWHESGLVRIEEPMRLAVQFGELLLHGADVVRHKAGRLRHCLGLEAGVRLEHQLRAR
jgi:hypothetical protein